MVNPKRSERFNLHFHPHEVVSCYRDTQLQVGEKLGDL